MELKSIQRNKRGILGIDTTKAVLVTLLSLAVIAVAVILALTTLRDSNVFTSGSAEYNATSDITKNVSAGVGNFFENVPTFFTLLGVVVLILIIAIIIVAVSRFGGGGRAESL